jgi:hypothetical protein
VSPGLTRGDDAKSEVAMPGMLAIVAVVAILQAGWHPFLVVR